MFHRFCYREQSYIERFSNCFIDKITILHVIEVDSKTAQDIERHLSCADIEVAQITGKILIKDIGSEALKEFSKSHRLSKSELFKTNAHIKIERKAR